MSQNRKASTVKKIFEYDNYRIFLEDFFNEQRNIRSSLSKRYFARKVGFSSHSQISHLIAGRRNITPKTLHQFISLLDLDGKAADYFITLVQYNQAKKLEEKEKYFKKLNILRQKVKYYSLNKNQYKYFDKWYYSVVREIVVYSNWHDDYKLLAKSVEPPISVEEAREAIKVLLELGLIKRNNDGTYSQSDNILFPGDIPAFAYKKARRDMALRGIQTAENISPEERYLYNCTLSLSQENFQKVMCLLKEFEKEFESVLIMEDSKNISQVHQLNIQFFPVSKKLKQDERL